MLSQISKHVRLRVRTMCNTLKPWHWLKIRMDSLKLTSTYTYSREEIVLKKKGYIHRNTKLCNWHTYYIAQMFLIYFLFLFPFSPYIQGLFPFETRCGYIQGLFIGCKVVHVLTIMQSHMVDNTNKEEALGSPCAHNILW